MKAFFLAIFLSCSFVAKSQLPPGLILPGQYHKDNDSLVWSKISRFCFNFNQADTEAMKYFIPEDFILQWMHENFIAKRSLLREMSDTGVLSTMRIQINHQHNAIVRYSDDFSAVCVNTGFEFLNAELASKMKQKNGYGVCIVYLEKINGEWFIKTIHLDIHCTICPF